MILFDLILIIFGIFISVSSYRRICFEKNASVANYTVLIIFAFCILPIILNYIMGIPTYTSQYWYRPFIEPMKNVKIGIIYDIYILCAIFSLYFIECKRKKYKEKEVVQNNFFIDTLKRHKIICLILILSPLLLIICNGTLSNYAIYNTTQNRGLSEVASNRWVTPLLLMSLCVFFSITFKENISKKKIFISFIYFFVVAWISGKRFIFANILILSLFYLSNMDLDIKFRKKMYYLLPIIVVILVMFSGFYLSVLKPAKVHSDNSVYDMLRVDFGRDDVIKYVINKEFFEKEPILDYRGESFLSLVFELLPRKIWKNKPYEHYMYLTSSILELPVNSLPAGTTPCWFEMCLCNFSYFGFFIAIYSLCFISRLFDKTLDVDLKGVGMLLISVLLTQSMDVYFTILIILFIMIFFRKIYLKKNRQNGELLYVEN